MGRTLDGVGSLVVVGLGQRDDGTHEATGCAAASGVKDNIGLVVTVAHGNLISAFPHTARDNHGNFDIALLVHIDLVLGGFANVVLTVVRDETAATKQLIPFGGDEVVIVVVAFRLAVGGGILRGN